MTTGYRVAMVKGILLALMMGFGVVIPAAADDAQKDKVRREIDAHSEEVLQAFIKADPSLRAKVTASEGYVIYYGEEVNLGVVGKASSVGILHDNREDTNTYLNIDTYHLGVAAGSTVNQVLAIVRTRSALEALQKGKWYFGSKSAVAVGDSSSSATSNPEDIDVYVQTASGVTASATLNWTRVKVNANLTDTGVSTFGIANIGMSGTGGQGEKAPRVWQHALPFMGQKVIDMGYDLPLPYGIGVTYASLKQDMEITNLQVGFNDNPVQPYEFVAFTNVNTDLQTPQLKADVWLFPFLNVYVNWGKVTGDVNLQVNLDGDALLDQLGTDCDKIIPPIECIVLSGKTVSFPVTAPVDANPYGVGAVLAGGWHDWFLTIPFNYAKANGNRTIISGHSTTITPRGGYVFNLENLGRLSVFVGGNYLKSRNKATGALTVPGTDIVLNYNIDQRNSDAWTGVAGFNWDVSPILSLEAEYNGFFGSREGWIASLTVRF